METFDGHIQLNCYDAEGLRYEMEENGKLVRFIFNQNREVVSEEDNSGLNRLIRGTELIAANSSADSARTYYHYASDEMGSTTHIVNEAGAVQNRYEYDAWGNITAQEEAIPNRFKFTGQQFDPVTQQYYLRARFYNPVVARFTQEDTYRGDGLNLYAYCANNPICYVDYTGHEKDVLGQAGQEPSFADQFEKHYQEELAFNKEHGLTTYYDTPEAQAQNATIAANQPQTPQAEVPTVRQNYETGMAYQEAQTTALQQRSTIDAGSLRTEVALRPYDAATGTTSKQGTIRVDAIATEGGIPKIYEMKSSQTAPYTPNQTQAGFASGTLAGDYVVVGKSGGDVWKAGTVIPAGTKVETIRKK